MPRALVTGGAGFLGSHLCRLLLERGFNVVAMDNLITGARRNIAALETDPRFEFIHHDVSKHIEVPGLLDRIYHLASPASPIDYLEFPIQTLKVGSLGTHNVLGLALAKKSRLMLASTSEVYGDPAVHPQPESYWGHVNPVGPRGVYDEAKRFAEAMTMAYHRFHGVDTRIARIFNTFGPAMRPHDGRVVSNFIIQALNNQPLTIYGDGSQTRSFCYVSDLIEGFWKLVEENDDPNPVNLGNPDEYTVLDCARLVRDITHSASEIVHKPLPEDDPKVRRPDITRARTLLKWSPKVHVRDGIATTVEYFRSLPPEELRARHLGGK